MQVLTAFLERRKKEGKGKIVPQQLAGVRSPPTHTVWTRGVSICPGRSQGGIASGAAHPLLSWKASEGMCVCVCLSVRSTLSEGRRTVNSVWLFCQFSLVVSHPKCYLCDFPRELFPAEEPPPSGWLRAVRVDVFCPGTPGSDGKAGQEPLPRHGGRGSLGLTGRQTRSTPCQTVVTLISL